MTPMLILSPAMLDQSFPRGKSELQDISISLGEIASLVEAGSVVLLNLDIFSLFIEDVYWHKADNHPELIDVVNVLSEWLLRPPENVKTINVDFVLDFSVHPVPVGTESTSCVAVWQEQVGKLLRLHDLKCEDKEFYIGVACDRAFACGEAVSYAEIVDERSFPLVGPLTWKELGDCFTWNIPNDIRQRDVSFYNAMRNVEKLGGNVSQGHATSHVKVTFADSARSWTLSRNVDPQPERFLKQLCPLVNLPFEVVHYVLLEGDFPAKEYRLQEYLT